MYIYVYLRGSAVTVLLVSAFDVETSSSGRRLCTVKTSNDGTSTVRTKYIPNTYINLIVL